MRRISYCVRFIPFYKNSLTFTFSAATHSELLNPKQHYTLLPILHYLIALQRITLLHITFSDSPIVFIVCSEISPKVLWPRLASTPNFFGLLPWMEGASECSYLAISYLLLSYLILSQLIFFRLISSSLMLSCLILSPLISSYLILSHLI